MKKMNSIHVRTKEKQHQIIDAALLCFTELGFNETSIQDICKRAGASIGSIYHHFKSKEQLAAAIYMDGIVEYQEGLIVSMEQEENVHDGISAIIRFHLNWVADNFNRSRFLFQRRHDDFMKFIEDELTILNANFAQRFASWFKKNVADDKIGKIPPDILSALILGPCLEYTRLYLNGSSSTTVNEAEKRLIKATLKSLS